MKQVDTIITKVATCWKIVLGEKVIICVWQTMHILTFPVLRKSINTFMDPCYVHISSRGDFTKIDFTSWIGSLYEAYKLIISILKSFYIRPIRKVIPHDVNGTRFKIPHVIYRDFLNQIIYCCSPPFECFWMPFTRLFVFTPLSMESPVRRSFPLEVVSVRVIVILKCYFVTYTEPQKITHHFSNAFNMVLTLNFFMLKVTGAIAFKFMLPIYH